jgi:DNA-binding response OmpR family regulator
MMIVVLDERPETLRVLRMTLEAQGHHVFESRNALDALELLRRESIKISLIISSLDIDDGINLLQQVRADAELRDIPFVGMSAGSSPTLRDDSFTLGADAYLPKPLKFDALRSVIANLGVPA